MKRSAILLALVIMFTGISIAEAKIVADKELNDSVVFYFWDNWVNPLGIGSGGYWLTFIKHISKDNEEKYWIRIDSTRRDSISQYGKIYANNKEYKIEIVDNPLGIHQRAGIGGRVTPPLCPIHAFYIITADIINDLAVSTTTTKITLDFQNRKEIPFPISDELKVDFNKLSSLKKENYNEYARKP